MEVGVGVIVGVSVPWGVSFRLRHGNCRRFVTRLVVGAGVAPLIEECCLTPSEVAMRSPSEVGVGSRWDMWRMPRVFARVTLACIQGAALILAVGVGLVEVCFAVGACVGMLVVGV